MELTYLLFSVKYVLLNVQLVQLLNQIVHFALKECISKIIHVCLNARLGSNRIVLELAFTVVLLVEPYLISQQI